MAASYIVIGDPSATLGRAARSPNFRYTAYLGLATRLMENAPSTGSSSRPFSWSPRTISAEALAEVLECTLETINSEAARGALPGLKIGRGWIFPTEALEESLNERARREAEKRRQPRASACSPTPSPSPAPTTALAPKSRRKALPSLD